MSILRIISKYNTILLPICAVVGFCLPVVANTILKWLPNILFFLMFFTLLGVDQKALFQRLFSFSIWRFSIFQSVVICFIMSFLAYAIGIRGDLLLAISALSATSPLFASGALVNAMGFDALRALAKTIIATLIMPLTLLVVLWTLATNDAALDLVAYAKRLLVYIVCPIALSVLVKHFTPKVTLDKYYPKIAEFNIFLVLAFPLGLSGGFRATFDQDPSQAMLLFLVAHVFAVIVFSLTFLAYFKTCKKRAIIASTVSTGRNMILTYTIAQPFLGTMFLPLVGAILLPMYGLPLVAKTMINFLERKEI